MLILCMQIQKKLSGGADRGYASVSFNAPGDRLVSVSTSPDYALTVWDWTTQTIVLHAKAFGQDVFSAKFSPDAEGRLTTSGTGHIRFWKMATTFTGQKLQGSIGKFGKVELSDVAAFVELPDGKVLSGTETGALLMWEGNFIKTRLVRDGGAPCHEGEVTYLGLDRGESCVISAGMDGFVRVWDFKTVDAAESFADNSIDVSISPLAEFSVGAGVGIKALVDSGRHGNSRFFVLSDTKGSLRRLDLRLPSTDSSVALALSALARDAIDGGPAAGLSVLGDYHAGAITGLDVSPKGHIAVTCGRDGMVKCWNYANRELTDSLECSAPATCLRWVPLAIDRSGKSLVVGFDDGVIRRIVVDLPSASPLPALSLLKAYKPHNAPVTGIEFSEAQGFLFSSGMDGIVFVFSCGTGLFTAAEDNWLPLLFVTVSSAKEVYPQSLSVHQSAMNVLCTCSDGTVCEIDFTGIDAFTQQSGGEIQSYEQVFPISQCAVEIAKPQVAIEVSVSPAEVVESPLASEQVNGPASDDAAVTSPKLLAACYTVGSDYADFIVGTDSERSQVFQCSFKQPASSELMLGNYSLDGKTAARTPFVNCFRYSLSKNFLLIGASDGSLTLRPADSFSTFLKLSGHSPTSGQSVASVACSFDDKFLVSAGFDGSLVVHRINLSALADQVKKLGKELLLGASAEKPFVSISKTDASYLHVVASNINVYEGFDALDPTDNDFLLAPAAIKFPAATVDIEVGAYSIQDAKLKSEMDFKRKGAEELKEKVRDAIEGLREDFQYILRQNEKIPPEVRLKPKDLEVDTAFIHHLKGLGERAVQEVHCECAYELEKSEALTRKLRSRLMQNILMEEMPLSCLDPSKKRVAYSLRVLGINEKVQAILDSIGQQVKFEQVEESKRWAAIAAQKKAAKVLDEVHKRASKKDTTAVASDEQAGEHHMTSAAVRREFRKSRKASIDKHNQEKPSKDDDDAQDIEAIQVAQRTLGDYKLKCVDDYEVPEDQRINAQQKKSQLALLEESSVMMRLRFNQRFLNMRQLKKQMIMNICKDNARIREINLELNEPEESSKLRELEYDPLEYPDDRYEVTEKELREYAESRKTASWKAAVAPINSTVTGTKTFISCDQSTGKWFATDSSTQPKVADSDDAEIDEFAANNYVLSAFITGRGAAEARRISALESTIPCLMLAKAAMRTTAQSASQLDSQQRLREDRRRALICERTALMEKTATDISNFDDALDDLRLDRHTIVSDLKLAELKLLVLYQEYELLLTFEGKDMSLQQKLINCQKDKAENISSFNDQQAKLNARNDDLKQWNEKIQRIVEEYRELIADSNPSAEILGKIFKKKIKRVKNTDGEESDEDYEDDDDYDEEEEDVEDICPPGCELHFYESVLELRSRRLDAEDSVSEVQKRIDELKKTLDRLKQREKQIDKDLKQTGAEIQQFQQQKQAALNKIDVVVPLSISQLYAFETSGQLSGPKDVDASKLSKDEMFENSVNSTDDAKPAAAMNESRVLVTSMSSQSHVVIKRQ